jgi:hypothetical protein
MSASLQHFEIDGTHQRFGNGRRFDQYSVTGLDASAIFHQDFREFFNTGVSHRISP